MHSLVKKVVHRILMNVPEAGLICVKLTQPVVLPQLINRGQVVFAELLVCTLLGELALKGGDIGKLKFEMKQILFKE